MSVMRAKMRVSNVNVTKAADGVTTLGERLTFNAVYKDGGYPADGSDEDNSFAKWTPQAELTMSINNPDLWDKFTVGEKFYVDFTPAP